VGAKNPRCSPPGIVCHKPTWEVKEKPESKKTRLERGSPPKPNLGRAKVKKIKRVTQDRAKPQQHGPQN